MVPYSQDVEEGSGMRVVIHQTKKGPAYYIIRDVTKSNGTRSTETLRDLGTEEEIKAKYQCEDAYAWAQEQAREMEAEMPGRNVLVMLNPGAVIPQDQINCFETGYLFLQQVYYDLRIDLICRHIMKSYSFEYDLNDIMMKLVYERILHPSSKLSTCVQAQNLLEVPNFEYHDVPRALSILAKEYDFIQSELYEYSKSVVKRNTKVLYYDCTNFFFEIEKDDDTSDEEADQKEMVTRKHGASKEHRPLPIVQMGLFMDYTGIPLAMCLHRGNKNEQTTLIPIEQKIMRDFELSKFVVCTDCGLSSEDNRKYNNFGERSFITTVSIKDNRISKELQEWCLEPTGWSLEGDETHTYDIRRLEDTPEDSKKNFERIFYKERYIQGYDEERDIEFNQTLFVTYSLKYRDYTRSLREAQVSRAEAALNHGKSKLEKNSANDYKRFIKRSAAVVGKKGKKADQEVEGIQAKITYSLDEDAIANEARFDGFYAMETNLLDDVSDLLKITKGRWEIEESFRIMKHDFAARPVYVSRNDRIKAHFLTCFIALLVYRVLERLLDSKFTSSQILGTLRNMKMTKVKEAGYIPSYTRTDVTDALHDMAGFHTDYEIVRMKSMKGIIRSSKTRKHSSLSS
jgi:transposase